MELWDAVPDTVRAGLRPLDHAEAYPPPPPGCDPCDDDTATRPLRYLDLLAEAAVAGRLCGERERSLKLTRRALRLLDEDPDPLRAAWFWVQRSRLTQALARGDGWEELGTAQELVRGLPPSEVHAEVLSAVAGWSMLHEPGPDAMADAERAVEYARMVGAHDIELNARLTLGGLMVDAGDIEAGLAEMYEVKERATELGVDMVLARSFVNLPSVLEGVGRSEEAVRLLEEVKVTRRLGLLDSETWVWGNLAESLLSVGRWEDAARAAASAQRIEQSAKPRAGGSVRLAQLAYLRGDTATAARCLAEARAHFGTHDPMPQYALPMKWVALRVAAAEGRPEEARAELSAALDAGFPPGTQRYAWPCCSPPPPPRPTGTATPPPNRAAPRSSAGSARRRGTSPPGCPSGRPTTSGCAPNCCAPRAGASRTPGPRPSPRWSRWDGPMISPASASGSPRRCWPPAGARTSGPAPPNCCAWPTPSPPTWARRRWPGTPRCWPGAAAWR